MALGPAKKNIRVRNIYGFFDGAARSFSDAATPNKVVRVEASGKVLTSSKIAGKEEYVYAAGFVASEGVVDASSGTSTGASSYIALPVVIFVLPNQNINIADQIGKTEPLSIELVVLRGGDGETPVDEVIFKWTGAKLVSSFHSVSDHAMNLTFAADKREVTVNNIKEGKVEGAGEHTVWDFSKGQAS